MSASWERFRAALKGDRSRGVAVAPLVAADHAAFLAGLKVAEVIRSADLLSEALIAAHRLYQGDFLIVFSDVYVEAEAMGCELEFPENAPPLVIQDCQPEDLKDTIPQRDGRLPMMLKAARIIHHALDQQIPIFASLKDPFSAAALACGAGTFFELLVTQPDRAHLAVERAWQNQRRYLEALLDLGVNIIVGAPMASGGLLGAGHFRRFALEPISDLVSLTRSAGRIAGVHICGDSDPILELLAQLPAHFLSLESFEVSRWRQLVSDGQLQPAIMGYFPTHLLLLGSEREIGAEIQDELSALEGLPHLLSTACDVPQRCPPEKVQFFMQKARS